MTISDRPLWRAVPRPIGPTQSSTHAAALYHTQEVLRRTSAWHVLDLM